MNFAGNSWVRMTKWLVMTLAALAILAQPLLLNARGPEPKRGGCCKTCECCISSDSNAPQPASPAPARTLAKDWQLAAVLECLFAPAQTFSRSATFVPDPLEPAAPVPLFLRHCAILI